MELLKIEDFFDKEIISAIRGSRNKYPSFRLYRAIYKLIYENCIYPYDILGKWFYNYYRTMEEYSILKEVDKDTFFSLYCKLYNPISIFTDIDESSGLYNLRCTLYSIDDTAFSFMVNNISDYSKLNNIRDNIFSYIESNNVISGSDLVNYGINLGGEDNSW